MSIIKGGSFIIENITPDQVFTPEDFTEEHRMIAKTTADFTEGEVAPLVEELEQQKEGLIRGLMQKAGELGLLGADVAEKYDGGELGKVGSSLITENTVKGGAFTVAHAAHTGIGTLPIVFFGTEAQKQKYLPGLATGELIASYCLTEPSSGSDALGAKTKAVLSADGKYYILNGTKQFITNAGFADVFIVYAKVDGEHFTAFIVDRDTPGLSLGPEEKKMGIKGSSTRPVILEDARVPVENVLGEIGKGHVVAFNILNIGRYKLGAACIGSSKYALEVSIQYALERKQFGRPIADFGMIRSKLAKMATRIYVGESMVYRNAGLLDDILSGIDQSSADAGRQAAKGIEEYAIECSINKVFASEVLDFVTDEAVQIYGGYGFIQEYPVERMYRDSRINRIFEGTNEINRLIIPSTLLRKGMKGELPLLAAAQKVMGDVLAAAQPVDEGLPLGLEKSLVDRAKKIALLFAGVAAQKLGNKLAEEQEILGNLADAIIEIFAMESVVLRTEKALAREGDRAQVKAKMARLYCYEAFQRVESLARETLAAVEQGDTLRTQLSAVKKLARVNPVNTIGLQRDIADRVIADGRYNF
ncbi:MAG: acyl-CoA dehydrogenase family protein [Clostridia bacterium]|nr:acyl-CoA dehydrogenase family protein [Clostridia bacterium]